MVTLKDIAERAGVSVSLVSGVINDSPYVRMTEATKQKVLDIIEESGYVPNHSARSLKFSRTDVLAVIIPHISDPIFEGLLAGVYAGAEKYGYVVMLGDARELVSGSKLLERIMGQGQVDGTLIRHSATLSNEVIGQLAKRRVPVVLMDVSDTKDLPWVGLDERNGTARAARHLLSLGHQRIGFLGGEREYPGTQRRIEGVRGELGKAGLHLTDKDIWFSHQEPAAGYATMRRLLESGDVPTGLVVNNVTTATGVLAAVADAGLRVPDDLSLVAYLDYPAAALVRPAITTVDQPLFDLGYQSVELFERLRRGEHCDSYTIKSPAPRLIKRSTTRKVGPTLVRRRA
ncbi:LacI family DNA-binding transcriptional regulator [Kribbella sp. CA-245084]|uniref:LacI family DNA-binding transcriptional regulator n=1 Tax=Kribbella sp. CA-245084 TaxID=3239940 RepID=UPI003D8AFD97